MRASAGQAFWSFATDSDERFPKGRPAEPRPDKCNRAPAGALNTTPTMPMMQGITNPGVINFPVIMADGQVLRMNGEINDR